MTLNKFLFVVLALTVIPSQVHACQSGSRSSVATGQVFSNPPALSSGATFQQPAFQQPAFQVSGSSTTALPQGGLPIQQGSASRSQASEVAASSGSIGIPASSLVDPIFEVNDPNSLYAVDHTAWDNFLARYLVTDSQGLNRIHYGRVDSCDRQQLNYYLEQLQATNISLLNRDEQLAYWFNLYNAKTVSIVLSKYPVRSVRQIKQKLTDFVGPFDDEGVVQVLGKPLSLNDIESGIVRPIWNDPRIHYALNCASFGCPNLAPTAWTGHDLDARLNGAAYEFVNSGRAVKSGLFGVRTAKIYKWYAADFGGSDEAVLRHIQQYANCETARKISGRNSICGYFYDWSLNDGRITRRRFLEPLRR